MLHSMLARVAREFSFERAKEFAGNEFANFVRHDLAVEAKKRLILSTFDLEVKASVGSGNWAAVPWLAFFDPLVTTSATTGFYVVFLINAQTEEIILSLNQGTTEIYKEFGESERSREILRRRASDMTERIPEFSKLFSKSKIDLGSTEKLPMGYEAGHAFGRTYSAKNIDEEVFYRDLDWMLHAYSALVDRGGRTPTDTMMEDAGSTDIEETRRYVLSKRIERAANVRRLVLSKRGGCCEACGLDPVMHFGFKGPLEKIPLDVHHSKPIRELAEGESRRYKVPEDFLVLCPTCHRVIHKQVDPSSLDELKRSIKFEIVQKIKY